MYKFLNMLILLTIIFFVLIVYKHYSSSKIINAKNFNRLNINEILKNKVQNLPILSNDTNNVIVFNDSFDEEISDDKKRSFWDLLKNK
tara:strand:- start:344 stop:607 length:264 start_codon:yes stop_codon:yes gene_type:complete